LERQLRQTQKLEAIGTLASGIAHDFNNIITAITGNAELARMDLPAGNPVQEYLENVIQSARRAGKLTQQIPHFLSTDRAEAEQIIISHVIHEVVQLTQSTTRGSVEVRYEQTVATPPIQGDPAQIHQVLLNLCTNAVYAMRGQQGVLTISEDVFLLTADLQAQHPGLVPGSYVHVAVHDNGSGMPPRWPSASSNPSSQRSPPAKAPGSVCQSCTYHARKHGGTVTVYSKPAKEPYFTSISRFPRKPTERPAPSLRSPSSPDAASGSCSSTTRWSSRGHFCACLGRSTTG